MKRCWQGVLANPALNPEYAISIANERFASLNIAAWCAYDGLMSGVVWAENLKSWKGSGGLPRQDLLFLNHIKAAMWHALRIACCSRNQ